MLDHPQSLLPLPDGVSPEYLRFHRVCPAAINDSGAVELLAATDAILEDALPELALAFGRDVVTVPADWEQIEQRLAAYGTSEFLTRDSDDEHADLRDLASQAPVRISAEVDHPFRAKPITCFGRSRSLVSVQVDHPFRSKPITCFG